MLAVIFVQTQGAHDADGKITVQVFVHFGTIKIWLINVVTSHTERFDVYQITPQTVHFKHTLLTS